MDENAEQYYRVLNVEPTASPEEVRRAYEDLIRVWDPQRFGHSPRLEQMAEEKLKEVVQAYRVLAGITPPAEPVAAAPPVDPSAPPPVAAPVEPIPEAIEPAAPAPQPVEIAAAVVVESQPGQAEPAQPRKRVPMLVLVGAGAVAFGLLVAATMAFIQGRTEGSNAASAVRQSVAPAPAAPAPAAPAPEPVAVPVAGQAVEPGPAEPPAPPPKAQARVRQPRRAPKLAPEQPRQYANGTELMEPRGRSGAGRFRVSNQSGQEAVVRVAERDAPGTPLRLVYIKPDSDVTIGGIGTGIYTVGFSLGPVTSKPRAFTVSQGPFQFIQIEGVTGSQSDEYRLVIRPQ